MVFVQFVDINIYMLLFQGITEVFVGIGFMSGPPIGGFLYGVSNYDADAITN